MKEMPVTHYSTSILLLVLGLLGAVGTSLWIINNWTGWAPFINDLVGLISIGLLFALVKYQKRIKLVANKE